LEATFGFCGASSHLLAAKGPSHDAPAFFNPGKSILESFRWFVAVGGYNLGQVLMFRD